MNPDIDLSSGLEVQVYYCHLSCIDHRGDHKGDVSGHYGLTPTCFARHSDRQYLPISEVPQSSIQKFVPRRSPLTHTCIVRVRDRFVPGKRPPLYHPVNSIPFHFTYISAPKNQTISPCSSKLLYLILIQDRGPNLTALLTITCQMLLLLFTKQTHQYPRTGKTRKRRRLLHVQQSTTRAL